MPLHGVAALAKGLTIACEPRLVQGHFGHPEHDIIGRRVNTPLRFRRWKCSKHWVVWEYGEGFNRS
jgi:hypothetical protein